MNLRKLLSAVLVVSLVFSLVGTTVFAAGEEQAYQNAIQMLKNFSIVTGDQNGDVHPEAEITRAEMIKILVTAAGKGEDAKLLAGAPAFSDTQAHWSSGYAALAKNMGITTGYPDGSFNPDGKVTYAEAVTMLARLVKLTPTAAAWPANYIAAASEAGIIPADIDVAQYANAPAVRGAVFVLANNSFSNVPIDGKNLYQKVHDTTAPALTVDAVSSPTTATKATVSGKVSDATSLTINGEAAEIGADGAFSADIELALGANDIAITAVDLVGNEATSKVAVERNNAPVAKVDAPATLEVAAGDTADVAVKVLDQNDVEIASPSVDATVAPDTLGTYADGKFTAAATAGTGTLTLKSGDVATSVAVTVKAGAVAKVEVSPATANLAVGGLQTFTAKAFDASGNEVSGQTFTFSATGAGALVNPSTGDFIASAAGSYTITAAAGDVKGTATAAVYSSTVSKVVVSAPATIPNNASSEIELVATIQDANGNTVASADGSDWTVTFDDASKVLDLGADFTIWDVNPTAGVAKLKVKTKAGVATGAKASVTARVKKGTEVDKTSTAVTVETAAQKAVGVKITTEAYLSALNSTNTVVPTAEVIDEVGKSMKSGTWQVKWTISGPADLIEGSSKVTSVTTPYTGLATPIKSSATIQSRQAQTGAITVTATVEGVGSDTKTVTAAIPGDAAKLVVTTQDDETQAKSNGAGQIRVYVRAVDANGVPTTSGLPTSVTADIDTDDTDEVYVSSTNGKSTSLDVTVGEATKLNSNGEKSVDIDNATGYGTLAVKVKALTGNLPITFKASKFTSGTTTLSFVSDSYTQIVAEQSTIALSSAGSPEATFKFQLKDAAGNKVATSGVKVKLKTTSDDVTINGVIGTTGAEVSTDASGIASFKVAARQYTKDYDLSASGKTKGGADMTATAKLSVKPLVAVDLKLSLVDDANVPTSTAASGAVTHLYVEAVDQYGNTLTDLTKDDFAASIPAGSILDTYVNSEEDASVLSGIKGLYIKPVGSKFRISFKPKAQGTLQIDVKQKSLSTPIVKSAYVGVRAGTPKKVKIVRDSGVTNIDVTKGVPSGPYTVQLTDENGNVVPNDLNNGTVNYTVKLSFATTDVDSGTYFTIRESENGATVDSNNQLSIKPSASSANFWILSNDTDGVGVTVSAASYDGSNKIADLSADSEVTFTAK